MSNMSNTQKKNDWGRFDFLGISKSITVVSVALTFLSLVLVGMKGFNFGVDFAGGIEIQVMFKETVDAGRVRSFMADNGFDNANVQNIGGHHEYLINIENLKNASEEETNKYITTTVEKIKAALGTAFANEGAEVRQVNTVGPQIGKELRRNGTLAGFYCLILILVYVGLRFDYRFAPAAVFCLLHDAAITMGIYSLLSWEFTVQTMAAVLTIIGYSLNDTIVIFDRIRENQTIHRDKDLYWIANRSLNETLSRTILTYVTTSFIVVTMYIFADGVIQDFARTMIIGMALGVFSTVYVATPLMLLADRYQKQKRQRLQQAAYSSGGK